MGIPGWAWAAGAAALAIGGTAVVANASSSSSAPVPPAPPSPTPPAATAAAPIPIVQGHRYQVTLTFGGATTAAALLASVVPNVASGLSSVAPGEFSLVSAIAPNATQVVYVVDAIGGDPGSTLQESPQTFYADLNAASMGGIGVDVSDMGPSPAGSAAGAPSPTGGAPALPPGGPAPSAPPGSPPALPPPASSPGSPPPSPPPATSPAPPTSPAASGPLTASSPVTDAALVTYAQVALSSLLTAGVIKSTGGAITPNGNPSDPPTLAAAAALQALVSPGSASGQLDYATWGQAVLTAQFHGLAIGTDETLIDAPTVLLAQQALAAAIGRGNFPSVDYGASQANGVASDPAWVAALTTAMGQFNKAAGNSLWKADGTLDLPVFAVLLSSAYMPPATVAGIAPVTPATIVTDRSEITLAQQSLQQLAAQPDGAFLVVTPAVVVNGDATDPGTVAALTAYQAAQTGLQHRTSPGVLDYLTLASVLGTWLVNSNKANTSLARLVGPPVTSPPVVAGTQEALALASSGRLSSLNLGYTASQVDGNPQSQPFLMALATLVPSVNAGTASQGFALSPSPLDYYVFATIFVVAYM